MNQKSNRIINWFYTDSSAEFNTFVSVATLISIVYVICMAIVFSSILWGDWLYYLFN